jgi:tetratricopeptide (TPR) repeat protein
MLSRPNSWIYFILLSCLPGFLSQCSAAEPRWIEVRSPHFSVVTDVNEKHGREIALHFEQVRAVFGTLLNQAQATPPDSPQIVAFRSPDEMRQFAPLWNGKPTQIAGFFQQRDDRSFIVLDASAENPWRVILHEYAHELLNGSLSRRFDPWFTEGFAGYFSSLEVDSKETRVGSITAQDYETLQRDGMFQLSDLLRVRQNSNTYNEAGDRRSVFYTQSAMLVHYLYDNSVLPALFQYFELKDDKQVPIEEAVQQAFGMTTLQLDKALRDYVKLRRYRTQVLPVPPGISRDDLTVSDLSASDQSFILADVHLQSPDYEQRGFEELKQLLHAAPGHGPALRSLGYVFLQTRQFAEARECFQHAITVNGKDARAHYYSALLISRERGFNDLADLASMKRQLEIAISLDPGSAEAHSLLALVQTFRGDSASGLESMQKAVRLNPHNETYRFNLAQIYLHTRNADPAIALLQGIDSSGNEALTKRIAESMKNALEMRVASAGRSVSVPGILMLTP